MRANSDGGVAETVAVGVGMGDRVGSGVCVGGANVGDGGTGEATCLVEVGVGVSVVGRCRSQDALQPQSMTMVHEAAIQ